VHGVQTLDETAPSGPATFTASAVSGSQIDLSWSAASDGSGSGVAEYTIYRGTSANAVTDFVTATSGTSFSDRDTAGSWVNPLKTT